MGGKIGEAAWDKAVKVWSILKPEVEKEPEVAKAIQDVAQNAEDPDAKAALSWQLKKLDLPEAAISELQKIISDSRNEIHITTATSGGVAIGGNSSGNIITTNYQGSDRKA
jgi:thioredoxin-like negative regulator of GroEL